MNLPSTDISTRHAPRPAKDYDDGLDVRDLFGIFRRRAGLILSIVLLVTALAVAAGFLITPSYTAKALLIIDPREAKIVDVEAVVDELDTSEAQIETEIQVLASPPLIERLVFALNLYDDPEFNPTLRASEGSLAALRDVSASFLARVAAAWSSATGRAEAPIPILEANEHAQALAVPDDPILTDAGDPLAGLTDGAGLGETFAARGLEATIANFADHYAVTPEGQSFVIGISFTSVDPEKAARIANAMADLYVEGQRRDKLDATRRASAFLTERVAQLRSEVEEADRAIADYRREQGLAEIAGSPLVEQELLNLQAELALARARHAETQGKVRQIQLMRERGESLDSLAEVQNSPVMISLREQELELLRNETELRATFGDLHPQIRNIQGEKRELGRKIAAELGRIVVNLENEADLTSARVDALNEEINLLAAKQALSRDAVVGLSQLEHEADAVRTLYQTFLARLGETREQEALVEPDARVIAYAPTPEEPSSPGPKLLGLVGFTTSTLLATVLALLMERMDNGIRGSREVEQGLQIPTRALVPHLKSLKRNHQPHHYLIEKPLSAYAEAIRSIAASLERADGEAGKKAVLVTSSLPQEGKTTLALSLATSIAATGKRCLIVDLDLRHPTILRYLGIRPATGLVEYVEDLKAPRIPVIEEALPGLDVLPVHGRTRNPHRLLTSARMKTLMTAVREKYDWIVIDSAPLIGITDTITAARFADRAIFAIRWHKTPLEVARNGLAALREAGVAVDGAVVTMVDVKAHARYGYGDAAQYYRKYTNYYVD